MYILEYVTEWENGESVLNRFECETWVEANFHMQQAKDTMYSPNPNPYTNHSFQIEEVN